MELKDVLGEIESDGAHLVHERLLEWALTPPLWHAEAVGGVHTIRPVARPLQERILEGNDGLLVPRPRPAPAGRRSPDARRPDLLIYSLHSQGEAQPHQPTIL